MKKNYVLDTNVLLHEFEALSKFEDNNINIPITVIEEIDRFKKNLDNIGRNARQVSRYLDALREKGDLREGVPTEAGGIIRVLFEKQYAAKLPPELHAGKADNRILAVCLLLQDLENLPVVFVTKDTNLRIKADVMGIKAEDYESGKIQATDLYEGTAEYLVRREQIDDFYRLSQLDLPAAAEGLNPNQYLSLVDETDPNHSALGRHMGKGKVIPLRVPKDVWGIRPKNREQRFALDALMDPNVQLVTLIGRAGTGKTLLAIAAGLQKAVEEHLYKRLLVSRPIFPMGRDIGFLPGDVQEKLAPWMQPIFDNMEFLLRGANPPEDKDKDRERERERERRDASHAHGGHVQGGHAQGQNGVKKRKVYEELIEMDLLSIEPLTYIRGRSIPFQYIIVDEAQNLTPHECKTIITRAGEGTKIVLTGDPYQIDNPYIDKMSNGLSHCVERFKGQAIAAHVTLTKGERSGLAELAANIL